MDAQTTELLVSWVWYQTEELKVKYLDLTVFEETFSRPSFYFFADLVTALLCSSAAQGKRSYDS